MNSKLFILSFLCLFIYSCGYTILKEEELSESEILANKIRLEEKKISQRLLQALKLFEQYKQGFSNYNDSIDIFRNSDDFIVNQDGKICLQVIGDYKREEISDSLLTIGTNIEKVDIITFGRPKYTIWSSPNIVRRIACWHFIELITEFEKPIPGHTRTE
jgi:hypothetical protein